MFFNVFQYLARLPKWLQNAPQIDPEAAKLIPKWPSWRSCWPILALLAAIFAPSSSNLSSKRPQDEAWEVFFSILLVAFCKYRGRPSQNSQNDLKMDRKCSKSDPQIEPKLIHIGVDSTILEPNSMLISMPIYRYVYT